MTLGHKSFVNSVHWIKRSSRIISASSDGTIRIWDSKSTECLREFTPGNLTSPIMINSIHPVPKTSDEFVVCNRSNTIYIVDLQGQVLNSFTSSKRKGGDFLHCLLSPKGEWLYGVAEDRNLYCSSTESNQLENLIEAHNREVIGLHHHPHQNIICTYSDTGEMKLWKP